MLPSIIRGAAARFPDRLAYVTTADDTATYAQLDARSDAVARGMSAAGIGEGDVVALTLPSSIDYIVAYLAASKVGGITAGVNPRANRPSRLINGELDATRPSWALMSRKIVHSSRA